jgi:hypothetical protein
MLVLSASEVRSGTGTIPLGSLDGPLLVAMLVAILDDARDLHEDQQDSDNEQSKQCHNVTKNKVRTIGDRKR